ncbi:MAG: hypothetical protein BIFFINMI_02513 [Phycisphaerae bacterium]|nr:hypothetical protein [Phycisphaerae bacterium]
MNRCMLFAASLLSAGLPALAADNAKLPEAAQVEDLAGLPANTWTLIAVEDGAGGKALSGAVFAADAGRLYLWGIGGAMPTRNRYLRYELESFEPKPGRFAWAEALPISKRDAWADGKFPPFTLYGQNGDAKGPPLRSVGNTACNQVEFHDFDGVQRPSPLCLFNQACYDSKRKRVLFYAGGHTFALNPTDNTWTDLAPQRQPAACEQLAWAGLCYDPVNDEALLFGGGDALNLDGGAHTWLYDCANNTWRRLGGQIEPPLRCTAPIVYDPATQTMVLFGGYDQTAALNDTWVYRCKDRRWEQRRPDPSPPPMFAPAVAAVGGGHVIACEYNALGEDRTHSATREPKQTWAYDVAADRWSPVEDKLTVASGWMTAAGCGTPGVALMVAVGSQRRTYALRYDASAGVTSKLKGSPPGTVAWKYPDQRNSLADAPPPDPAATAKMLAALPANIFVDAKPPGLLISKTWSGAIMDTNAGRVIYTGGGHSGYSGNDWAIYDVAINRWSQAYPPSFPPYIEGGNASPWGYAYHCRPWSQHTYLWYGYDPVSKRVVYCPRMTIRDGVQLAWDPSDPDSAVAYDSKKMGRWTWVFDPATKKMSLPSLGRPFDNTWHLALCTTPAGLCAMNEGTLYKATVRDDRVTWSAIDRKGPTSAGKKGYHFEWQPVVYDSKRDRLIHLMGDAQKVEVHARAMSADGDGRWEALTTTGPAAICREVVYLPRQDALLMMSSQDKVYAVDCTTNKWRHLDVALPKGAYGTESAMRYDPVHDVVVALVPSRFSGPMQTLLFRYDPATARDKAE